MQIHRNRLGGASGRITVRVKLRRLWTIAVWLWAILLLLGMLLWVFASWSSYIKYEDSPAAEPSRYEELTTRGSLET